MRIVNLVLSLIAGVMMLYLSGILALKNEAHLSVYFLTFGVFTLLLGLGKLNSKYAKLPFVIVLIIVGVAYILKVGTYLTF